jgi:predicted permease
VVPAEFFGTKPGLAFEMWVPLMMTPQLVAASNGELDQGSRDYWTIARLARGVTVAQARGEIEALVRRLTEVNKQNDEGLTATVVPVWKAHTGGQSLLLAPLGILMAVCFVVLLIVCSNVSNLLLARSVARQREFSIRLALGAGRLRLARQLVAEVLLLAASAAMIGVPCALWMGKSLAWLLPPTSSPVSIDIQFNADIVGFAIGVCAATALVCSFAPVLHSARTDANEGLKEGGRSGTSGTRTNRMRNLLVVTEIALAFIALVGAGLFVRSFQATRAVHPGFDPRNVSVAQIDLSGAGFTQEQGQQFCIQLRDRLKSAPGIVGASFSDRVPLGFGLSPWQDIQVEGYAPARGENMKIYNCAVAPGFFAMMRIPMIEGRDFTDLEDVKKAPAIIVNQTFARRFFSDRNPIGRKVRLSGRWVDVVGVVQDYKYHSLAEDPQPYIFLRQAFHDNPSLSYFVRSIGGSIDARGTIRREATALNRDIAVFEAMSLTDYMGGSMFSQRIAASMLSVLGGISLILAALGLYGVMAYSVSQRIQEIGIRMALGAQRYNVLGMVIRQGMILTGVGLLTGLGAALATARLVSGLLFRVSADDPAIIAGTAIFLSTIAMIASSLPAWRAVRVDPLEALRHE